MDQKHSGECDIIAYGDSITFVMDQVQENREGDAIRFSFFIGY